MVYDCFTFFNELDLLDLRLHELDPVVDFFVIVEGNRTFSGKTKKFIFEDNQNRYRRFLKKIIYVKVTDLKQPPDIASSPPFNQNETVQKNALYWNREFYQRNSILRGLTQAKDSDLILIGDVDEIPKTSVIKNLRPQKTAQILQMPAFYYFLNCQSSQIDNCTRVLTYHQLKKTSPQLVRWLKPDECYVHPHAGWHFSYVGDPQTISHKIKSFSHQELNSQKYNSLSNIEFSIHHHLDLFHRGVEYKTIPINKTFPRFLQNHQSKFKKIINQHLPKPDDLLLQNEIQNSRFQEIRQQQAIDRLQQKINEQIEIINYQTQELANIKNSKFYRLWRQYINFKEKLTHD